VSEKENVKRLYTEKRDLSEAQRLMEMKELPSWNVDVTNGKNVHGDINSG
jgi:hypothetical protein